MSNGKARLEVEGRDALELDVYQGTIGPDCIDVSSLAGQGIFTIDQGFASTASCESKITYIDGEAGVLLHRGYPIDELANNADYLEVCYLLLNGELPSAEQKTTFDNVVRRHTMVNENIAAFYNGFRHDAHPMSMLCAVVAALSSFYHDSLDILDPEHREITTMRLISKMPTLAAMAYKHSIGQPALYPRNDLDYSSNFLYMMFGTPCEDYEVNPVIARAMDKIFILHADHEQNASTSTVRLAGSTGANPFACIASGIAALWGPSHGGANEAVVKMLEEIGDENNVDSAVLRAKDKNDSFRLMGFGHRVYKNFDPRAKVMKEACDEVLSELGIDDPLLKIAKRLEEIALEDDYFIEKKLYPNVDFYSGIILRAIGIPLNMFTVIFALGRTSGWLAHWGEMVSANSRIGRPRQLYTGSPQRSYTSIDKR